MYIKYKIKQELKKLNTSYRKIDLIQNKDGVTGKNKTQRIKIYYRFVGYIEMPAARTQPQFVADTRQGVAINYVA